MSTPEAAMDYEVSARRDVRWWAALAFGVFMFLTTDVADPKSCVNFGRECVGWLVPVLHWAGAAIALVVVMRLLLNPRRGSRIDPRTGYLVWWQKRYAVSDGKEGRIHPSKIGRIRIYSLDEGEGVELYDIDGVRQPHFGGEVIPAPYQKWAMKFAEQWPHIRVETK